MKMLTSIVALLANAVTRVGNFFGEALILLVPHSSKRGQFCEYHP